MNPGKLRHRIVFYHKVETENELGEVDFSYEAYKPVWADIIPQTGSLLKGQAETVLSNTTHKIVIRYTDDIKPDMYIMYRGQRFDINYILNPYFKNESLELFCTTVVE